MSLSQVINDNIKANLNGEVLAGSIRQGTACCSLYELEELFGQCHSEVNTARVTKEWYFETPRGRVTISDWWFNDPGTLSIASVYWRATLWMLAYLRRNKIKAHFGEAHHAR